MVNSAYNIGILSVYNTFSLFTHKKKELSPKKLSNQPYSAPFSDLRALIVSHVALPS